MGDALTGDVFDDCKVRKTLFLENGTDAEPVGTEVGGVVHAGIMETHEPRVVRGVLIQGRRPVGADGTCIVEVGFAPVACGGEEDTFPIGSSNQEAVYAILRRPRPGALCPNIFLVLYFEYGPEEVLPNLYDDQP